MPLLVFALLCLIWGFSWVAIKFTLEGIPPFLGAGLRFLIAVPLLGLWAAASRIKFIVPKKYLGILLLTAFLTYAFTYGLIYWAEQSLSAGTTAIFFATFPLFTGIYSHLTLRSENIGVRTYLGLLLGFMGVLLTFYEELLRSKLAIPVYWATIAVIVSAAGGAVATVLTKKHLQKVDPVTLSLNQAFLGGVGLVVFGFLAGEPLQLEWTRRALIGLVYLGCVASALAFVLYYWLLQRTSAVTVSTMIFVTPIVAVASDWWMYGSPVTLRVMLGAALIFLGILLSEYQRYRAQFYRASKS